MTIYADTDIEKLTSQFLNDVLAKENFDTAATAKSSFLTGGSIIVCESKGLQEYIQKKCADTYGIWTALTFKPLAGLLMRCAFDLSSIKKDEKENVFNQSNIVWAIYRLLEGEKKTFHFANELASLFLAYQIYRPKMIKNWNSGLLYTYDGADSNFTNNEKFQRELWVKIRKEYPNEQDIMQLYELIKKGDKNVLHKQIFIFAPVVIAPVQLEAFKNLSLSGCKVNLYLYQISREYIGETKSDKSISNLRKKAWENDKIIDENNLYWDLGNRLIANLGRAGQVLYEQIGWENFEYNDDYTKNKNETLLNVIQDKIINDNNEKTECKIDKSLTINSCFSVLREIEVLCDYLLGVLEDNKDITPCDIAVVSPNIDTYANAIESVFSRYEIPFVIADRDVKKHDKTARLLNMLFSMQGSEYEAPDVCALFEYSLYAQGRELATGDTERLEKWIKENAVRHGLENEENAPNYSFKTGFEQILSGFFMLAENGFSECGEYAYPDTEDSFLEIISEFIIFTEALKKFEEESKTEKTIEDWDNFFKDNLKIFFGTDEVKFNEDEENPYQKIIGAWDELKKEILIGFGYNPAIKIDFSILKVTLPNKLEENSKYHYTISGKISFSNISTLRAVPHKVVCCIGMNGKEFPRQIRVKEISLMQNYITGDKDTVNEDRLMFLETILSAKDKLYISWIGQNEKTAEELDPSSTVIMLIKNLKEQYGIDEGQIVKKYPLQPFSKRYLLGELETFDQRWNRSAVIKPYSGVWDWRIKEKDNTENDNTDELFRILSNAPKYFLKDVCNISLPEDADILENLEPFIIENGLDKWKLGDLVIKENSQEKIKNEIEISKRRGELPSGIFAKRIIEETINEVNELKEMAKGEKAGTYWIYPSKDKGKYRLKHWKNHLNYNFKIAENQNTKIFLKDKKPVVFELKGMKKEKACEYLNKLWEIKKELDTRLIPVFPDAAWLYIAEEDINVANDAIFEYGDGYLKLAFGDSEILEGEVEKEFIKYSKILFNDYLKYLKEGE